MGVRPVRKVSNDDKRDREIVKSLALGKTVYGRVVEAGIENESFGGSSCKLAGDLVRSSEGGDRSS